MDFDIALFEWPTGRTSGGPRLVGRIADPDLVATIRSRLAATHREELARLELPQLASTADARAGGAPTPDPRSDEPAQHR